LLSPQTKSNSSNTISKQRSPESKKIDNDLNSRAKKNVPNEEM
jgi:hypothetical protein